MRFLILHKTNSLFASDAVFLFERALLEAGDECVLRMLENPVLPEDASTFDVIILSGADQFIVQELVLFAGLSIPLCIFPGSSSNLFFDSLGNAAEPSALARTCRERICITTDLGKLVWKDEAAHTHSKTFAIMSGTGFDAELMRGSIPNKKAMGNAAYFLAAANNPHPNVCDFSITIDGRHYQKRGISCMIANTSMLMGNIEIVSDCLLTDGLLDCIVLEVPDTLGLMRPFLHGLLDPRGKALGRPTIFHAQGKHIDVLASNPEPLQIDGEPMNTHITHFAGEVITGANIIIVDGLSRYA